MILPGPIPKREQRIKTQVYIKSSQLCNSCFYKYVVLNVSKPFSRFIPILFLSALVNSNYARCIYSSHTTWHYYSSVMTAPVVHLNFGSRCSFICVSSCNSIKHLIFLQCCHGISFLCDLVHFVSCATIHSIPLFF